VGLEDLFSDNSITLFPNPNSGQFELAFKATQQADYVVTISNALGEKVYAYTLNDFAGEHRRQLDLQHLSKGLYFVQIGDGRRTVTKKVTLQ
jgi:hypothetical protein